MEVSEWKRAITSVLSLYKVMRREVYAKSNIIERDEEEADI